MTFELGRELLLSGRVSPEKLSEGLYAVVAQGVPLARALVGLGVIDEARLEAELEKTSPEPLQQVVPASELMDRLPPGLCHRLGAVPLSLDKATGTVHVAVLDPRDPHAASEVGYHLKRPVASRRASYAALREALEGYPAGLRALAPPMTEPNPSARPRAVGHTPVWGTPAPAAHFAEGLVRRKSTSTYLLARGGGEGKRENLGDAAAGERGFPSENDARFVTRTWDSPDRSEPASQSEASWEEPVFELRRLGSPPTEREPEPVTVRIKMEEAADLARPKRSSTPPLSSTLASSLAVPSLPLPPRVPVAANAPLPPYADLGSILANIRVASDRDAVLGFVLLGARTVARRIATMVVKKDSLVGWSCTPEFGDEAALKELKIPLRAPSLLSAVLSTGVHLGPLSGTVAAPLLRVMRTATQDVAIAALRVGDRPAVLVVADELGDTLLATKRIDELSRAAGDALLRILRARRE